MKLLIVLLLLSVHLSAQDIWPLQKGGRQWISSEPGPRQSNGGAVSGTYHFGTDIAARVGTLVKSVSAGTVTVCAYGDINLGKYIEITDKYGIRLIYGHLMETWIPRGTKVEVGQGIGRVGMTGRTDGPHLHFEAVMEINQYILLSSLLDSIKLEIAYCHTRSTQ